MKENVFEDLEVSAYVLWIVADLIFYLNFQLFFFYVELKASQEFNEEIFKRAMS